jgi:hypothetical protein
LVTTKAKPTEGRATGAANAGVVNARLMAMGIDAGNM